MGKINFGRVLLGGLVAGLVINIGEYLLNGVVLAKQMEGTFRKMNVPAPDGNFIAFAWKKPGDSYFDIYLHDLAKRVNTQLTQNAGDDEKPTWSPDGKHIAFESKRSGTLQIYSMLANGSNPRQLTFTGSNKAPAWSGYIK